MEAKRCDRSVIPTRYFLGRPDTGEEMHISIEKGKTLIIRLMAVGPVVEGRAQRDVWFEVNGEVRAVSVEDKNSAVETVSREKATSDPGSVGAPMSGVVVEVRVKEGQEIKKGDPLAGTHSGCAGEQRLIVSCSFECHENGICCNCSGLGPRQTCRRAGRRFDQPRRPGVRNWALTNVIVLQIEIQLCSVRYGVARPGHLGYNEHSLTVCRLASQASSRSTPRP